MIDERDDVSDGPETTVDHRQLDADGEEPTAQVVAGVSELEGTAGTAGTDLPPLLTCGDGMLDHRFSTPPDPSAQLLVEFSYAGYRITVEQDGTARFVKPG